MFVFSRANIVSRPAGISCAQPKPKHFFVVKQQRLHDGNSIFNDKSIIGETLDVDLHDGTYTWSNAKARRRDNIRPDDQSSTSFPSSQELNKERYKRIPFDGYSSILLHQEPESFVAPNFASDNNGKSLHRRRQKG